MQGDACHQTTQQLHILVHDAFHTGLNLRHCFANLGALSLTMDDVRLPFCHGQREQKDHEDDPRRHKRFMKDVLGFKSVPVIFQQ